MDRGGGGRPSDVTIAEPPATGGPDPGTGGGVRRRLAVSEDVAATLLGLLLLVLVLLGIIPNGIVP